jgi:hypothetical protein
MVSTWADWSAPSPESGLVVLLPGGGYTCEMPLLWFAGQVAAHHGWRVRAVAWEPTDAWRDAEVGRELEAAIGGHAGPVRVIAKSLGTFAAPFACDHGIDAIWLTPLLQIRAITDAMAHHPGRQLLIGGTGDVGRWDSRVAASLAAEDGGAELLEIAGADHSLLVEEPVRSAEIQVDVVRAIDRWFSQV